MSVAAPGPTSATASSSGGKQSSASIERIVTGGFCRPG